MKRDSAAAMESPSSAGISRGEAPWLACVGGRAPNSQARSGETVKCVPAAVENDRKEDQGPQRERLAVDLV